jgi:hypothetical protein
MWDSGYAMSNHAEQPRRRQTTKLLVIALLAACVFATYHWWSEYAAKHHLNSTRSTTTRTHPPQEVPFEVVDTLPANFPSKRSTEPSNAADEARGYSGAKSEDKRFLRLYFTSEDGQLLESITITAFAVAGDKLSPSQSLRGGRDGSLTVSCSSITTMVQILITDPIWHSDDLNIVLNGNYTEHSIILHKLVTVEFDIRYDDGEPFVGKVSDFHGLAMPSRTVDGKYWSGGGFDVQSNPCTVTGVSPRDTTLHIYASRAGYDRFEVDVTKDQLYDGARISITILKPKNPPGSIVVHFSADQFPDRFQYWYHKLKPDDYRGSEGSNRHNERPSSAFVLHEIRPGGYTLTITDERRCWLTHLDVTEGQETHVYADLAEPASASVRVIDENGDALPGACLFHDERVHIDYPVQPQFGVRAVSDAGGRAELPGLAPTLTSLLVEAEGYDTQTISVALSSGRSADLGTIRLVPSRGRIEIRLVNVQPGKSYEAMCIHPWGRGGNSTLVAVPSSGMVVFERMKTRDYLVAVHLAGGGKVVSKNVTVSDEQLDLVVELDVGLLAEKNK